MTCSEKEIQILKDEFAVLQQLVRPKKTTDMTVNLKHIDEIINKKVPETLQDNAPANFHVLYTDFKLVYDKFKDFILYDQLIGKNIIALGGGFSSGKSSFLNALMGHPVLPTDVNPSTSVPTYIVSSKDDKHHMKCVNVFDASIEVAYLNIQKIAYGFGKNTDTNNTDKVTFGHLLESIFFATPFHAFKNIAFLDTPGYSKPDTKDYSLKTDEQIARGQLNMSNLILWFVQADAGTISDDDIKFLQSLNRDIPILVILNKADKKDDKNLQAIKTKIKETLDFKGIRYEDVLTFSAASQNKLYEKKKIIAFLDKWNQPVEEVNFAYNFKKLFFGCQRYYEEKIDSEESRLSKLQHVLTLIEADEDIVTCLQRLVKEIQANLQSLKDIKAKLDGLKLEFFQEIKIVADIVHIAMPEPSEVDLIQDKIKDPLQVLQEYRKKNGLKENPEFINVIKDGLENIKPVFNQAAGGSEYKDEIYKLFKDNEIKDKSKIKFKVMP